MAERPHPGPLTHPTPITYLKVATVLAALTGVEVGVFYMDALESAFLPIFLVLSVVKFALVVMFYMHLKFDSRLFSSVFVGGLLLAVAVVVVLMSLFQVLSTKANPEELVAAHEAEPGPAEPGPVVVGTKPPEAPVTADLAKTGREIFLAAPANAGPQGLWCSACHQIEGVAAGLIGPGLTHIATDAATRKAGLTAEQYIFESIRKPEAFVAQGVERATPGLMTAAVTKGLTDEQVNALVAFLLEQK